MNRSDRNDSFSTYSCRLWCNCSWCFSSAAAAPSKLVIGYAATTARLMPLWIAQDQGFFTKYGIESEPVMLRGGTTLVTGLASGDVQIGRTAGAAVLSAVGAGHDLKMLATFSSRNSYDVVVRSNIKRAEDIRGKKLAINSLGGGTWIGAMLWLEHFGLDQQRDQILLQSIGDQSVQAQALETGVVDVAFVDGFYSKLLKQKGMTILADYTELKQPLGQSVHGRPTLISPATPGSRGELSESGNRRDGIWRRAEKQTGSDQNTHAAHENRCRGR